MSPSCYRQLEPEADTKILVKPKDSSSYLSGVGISQHRLIRELMNSLRARKIEEQRKA